LDAYPLPRIDDVINTIAKGRIFSALDLKSAYHQIHLHEKDQEFTAFEACGKLFQYRRLPFGVTTGVSVFQQMIDSIIEKYDLSGTSGRCTQHCGCGYGHGEFPARSAAASWKSR